MANLDLSLVDAAISGFPRPVPDDFQSGSWGRMPPEGKITKKLSLRVGQDLAATRIWTAKGSWSDDGNQANWSKSYNSPVFVENSKVDLAWTDQKDDSKPTVLVEVKRRSSGGVTDDHYRILGDIAYLAADVLFAKEKKRKVQGYLVFVAPVGESGQPWLRCLLPKTGILDFRIEPFKCKNKFRADPWGTPYCCDQDTGLLRLDHRSGYNRVFGRGTSAKFISVFDRPGMLCVKLDVREHRTDNGFWILLFRIVSVSLTGTKPKEKGIQQWWP